MCSRSGILVTRRRGVPELGQPQGRQNPTKSQQCSEKQSRAEDMVKEIFLLGDLAGGEKKKVVKHTCLQGIQLRDTPCLAYCLQHPSPQLGIWQQFVR